MSLTRKTTAVAAALLMAFLSANCANQESAQLSGADDELPIVESILHDQESPFYLDAKDYPAIGSDLPVGVFDSGTGGLTVLDAIINFDQFDNESRTWTGGGDGAPDLKSERFVYLADTANMPYGVCPQKGKTDLLKEHIIKDAWFLLNPAYYRTADAESPQGVANVTGHADLMVEGVSGVQVLTSRTFRCPTSSTCLTGPSSTSK